MGEVVSKNKVTISDACNPKVALAKMIEGKMDRMTVGTILGNAIDYVSRANLADENKPFIGFAGQFEVVPADPEADTTRSGVLFLPEAFHVELETALNAVLYPNPDKPDQKQKGGGVRFAAEIVLMQAKNPAGYSWGLSFTQGAERVDPLADLRKQLADKSAARAAKSLPKPDTKAEAAPAKETAKAK